MRKTILNIKLSTGFKEISFILTIFLITRLVTWYLGYTSYKLLEPVNAHRYVWNYVSDKRIDIWAVWDSGYYIDIAKNGYSEKLSTNKETLNQANYAFFPLYPLLLRFGYNMIHNEVLFGVIISNISLLFASIFLFYLVKLDFDEDTAQYSLLFLYAFPTAFILTSVYTEALFLCLSLASIYCGRNSNFLLAGIFGFFCALTRNLGLLLIAPLFLFAIENKTDFWRKTSQYIQILFIPLGTLLYSLYVNSITGNFLSFLSIQEAWGRKLGSPITYILEGVRSNLYKDSFTSIFVILAIPILLLIYKYLKTPYFLYSVALFFTPLFTGIASMPRYMLVIFPIYICLALLAKKSAKIGYLLLFISTLTQGMMLVFWTSGFDLLM